MRRIYLSIILAAAFAAIAAAQTTAPVIKTIAAPDPFFPAEANNFLYGDTVKVAVNVGKDGRVSATRVFGPLAPCKNLDDPFVKAIQKSADEAAKKTVFEPNLQNGAPIEKGLMITYRIRPKVKPLLEVDFIKPKPQTGVVNGKAIDLQKPFYTRTARENRIYGDVELAVLIDEEGKILSVGPISGHPALVEGTLESACKSRYSPTTFNGQPVKVMGKITYKFVR